MPDTLEKAVDDLGAFIRDQREARACRCGSLSDLAGISNPYLSQIERGLRKPSADILQQIAKGLRISAEALYVQGRDPRGEARECRHRRRARGDPSLTERQKQVLLDVYQSFRRESAAGSPEPDTVLPGPEPGAEVPGSAH